MCWKCVIFPCIIFGFLIQTGNFSKFTIEVSDILAENLMPSALLMLENPESGVKAFNNSNINLEVEIRESLPEGSFVEAIKTMTFHRQMMNQYLCRTYVAEQVVSVMSLSKVKRRMGHVTPGIDGTNMNDPRFQRIGKSILMTDEGSANYKDWLTKSTTLEDIYRHYNKEIINRNDKVAENDEKDEDFDEDAALSDYSSQKGVQKAPMNHRGEEIYYSAGGGGYSYPSSYSGGNSYYSSGSSGGGNGGGYDGHGHGSGGYAVHEPTVEHIYEDISHEPEHVHITSYHGPPKYHGSYDTQSSSKGKDLSEFFEIALTALAYLAFKIFIVHVIMYIASLTSSSTTQTNMMAMSMSPTATGTGMGMTGTGTGGGNTGTGGGATTTGGGNTSTGGGNTDTGGGTTGTGEGGTTTGGGNNGTGGGPTTTSGGSTTTGGGGNTATGGGSTGTGEGGTSTGGGSTSTGAGNTGTGGGTTGTGGGTTTTTGDNTSTGGGNTGTGGGSTGTGGSNTSTGGTGGGSISTGSGGGTSTGGGSTDGGPTSTGGGATTDTGGGTTSSDGNTGGASPGTGTGTGDGSTGTGGGSTGTGTGTGGETGDGTRGDDTMKFRFKRNVAGSNVNTNELNELARRILVSIESALFANVDEGVCLRKSLCETNKWSRSLDNRNKIVIPIWSLGMSWLAGKFVKTIPPTTSMIDTLKASILGLGKANCEIIYQSCDYRMERAKRRRKRRKRHM